MKKNEAGKDRISRYLAGDSLTMMMAMMASTVNGDGASMCSALEMEMEWEMMGMFVRSPTS